MYIYIHFYMYIILRIIPICILIIRYAIITLHMFTILCNTSQTGYTSWVASTVKSA